MPQYHVYIAERPTLLEDLLEASMRLFHNRCAVIQRIFHQQWGKALRQRMEHEQAQSPGDGPDAIEARAREWLQMCRGLLREKQREMIRYQEAERCARDEAIRVFAASRELGSARLAA